MVKYTLKEALKKLNGRKTFWEVLYQTKTDKIHQYFFDSYTEAKDYFDGCMDRNSKIVRLAEFYMTPLGIQSQMIDSYPKRK